MNEDNVTRQIKRALDVLFICNPTGTSLGIFLGVFIDWAVRLFLPSLPINIIDIAYVKSWHFTFGLCSLGIFSMNIKPYFDRNKIDQSIIENLYLIEQLRKERKITEDQAKLRYVELIKTVTKNTVLKAKVEHTT